MVIDDLHPAPLPPTAEGGDTQADPPSYREANAGPHPSAVQRPQGREGNRRPVTQSEIDELLQLPFKMGDISAEIRELRGITRLALAPISWANAPASANVTGTAHPSGTGSYLIAAQPLVDGTFVELRNVIIGASAAGVYQLIASMNDALYNDTMGQRTLCVVRLTASALSFQVTQQLTLRPRERLFLLNAAASVSFDFSAEYRGMRSE